LTPQAPEAEARTQTKAETLAYATGILELCALAGKEGMTISDQGLGMIARAANKYAPQLQRSAESLGKLGEKLGGEKIELIAGLMNKRTRDLINLSKNTQNVMKDFSQSIMTDAAKEGLSMTKSNVKEYALRRFGPIFDRTDPTEQVRLMVRYNKLQRRLQKITPNFTLKRLDELYPDASADDLRTLPVKIRDFIKAQKGAVKEIVPLDYLEEAAKQGYVPVPIPRNFTKVGADTGKVFHELYANSGVAKILQHFTPIFSGQSNAELRLTTQQNLINQISDLVHTAGEKISPKELTNVYKRLNKELARKINAQQTLREGDIIHRMGPIV